MAIPFKEQETVITYGREETAARIYTTDTTVMMKLDKLYKRVEEKNNGGEVVAVTYSAPKNKICFRSLSRKAATPAQIAARAANLKKARAAANGK